MPELQSDLVKVTEDAKVGVWAGTLYFFPFLSGFIIVLRHWSDPPHVVLLPLVLLLDRYQYPILIPYNTEPCVR